MEISMLVGAGTCPAGIQGVQQELVSSSALTKLLGVGFF